MSKRDLEGRMNLKKLIKKFGTPLYVYEEDLIRSNYARIKDSFPEGTQIYYAVMCNDNQEVLRILQQLGSLVQINSVHELELVTEAGFRGGQISFTSVGISTNNLERLI